MNEIQKTIVRAYGLGVLAGGTAAAVLVTPKERVVTAARKTQEAATVVATFPLACFDIWKTARKH